MPQNSPYEGETQQEFQARMAKQQAEQQAQLEAQQLAQQQSQQLAQQQARPRATDSLLRNEGATVADNLFRGNQLESGPAPRVSDQEAAEQNWQGQYNSTQGQPVNLENWPTHTPLVPPEQAQRSPQEDAAPPRSEGVDPREQIRREPTPLAPEVPEQQPQQVTPVPEEGLEPIPQGMTGDEEQSVLAYDPHNRTGEELLDSILADSDPVGDGHLEQNIRAHGEEIGKKKHKQKSEKYERGHALNPMTGEPLKGGMTEERITRDNATHAKNQRYSEYFRSNIIDPRTGQIDKEKLSDAPYDVRAWYETQQTIRGGGVERRGGGMHSDWDQDLTPAQRSRYERLVKKIHFGTKGRGGLHVVPHPTQKGNFIAVDSKGRPVPSNKIDIHGRMSKAEQLEANKARVEAQPERYARARQIAGDRRRVVDARREFRRGNVHMGVSKMMNLPPDHPSVVDQVKRMQGNRSWFSGGRGPSDSAAYYATYFGEGEQQRGGRFVPGQPARPYRPSTPQEQAAYDNYQGAKARAVYLDQQRQTAASGGQDTSALDAEIMLHKNTLQKAEERFQREGGSGSQATEGRWVGPGGGEQRADLRGQMPGHWDRMYVKGDDPWQESTTPGLHKPDGTGVHGLQRSYDEWEDPREVARREQEQAANQTGAGAPQQPGPVAPQPQGPGVGPGGAGAGAENVDTTRIPVPVDEQGRPREVTELDASQEWDQLEDSGAMTGMGLYEDNAPQDESESILRSGAAVPSAPVPERDKLARDGDSPVKGYNPGLGASAGYNPETGSYDASRVQPYQPVVDNQTGEIRYEEVNEARAIRDHQFDQAKGKELYALYSRLSGRQWGKDQGAGMTGRGQGPAEEWYAAFMQQARQITSGVSPAEWAKLPPEQKVQIDREIQRWGDRHLSANARNNRGNREDNPQMGYPSVYWDTMSPTLNRGRKPAVSQPEEQPGFWDNVATARDWVTGNDPDVDRPWYQDLWYGDKPYESYETMEEYERNQRIKAENRRKAQEKISGPLWKWW